MKEVEYIYIIGISESKEKETILLLTKQDIEGKKEVIMEITGEDAKIWLDFFYKLHEGKAKVIVDRE